MKQFLFRILVLVGFSLCAACSTLEDVLPKHSDNRVERIQIVATDDVNQDTAVAVDVVYIFEEALVTQLLKYSARKWFTEKEQFRLQYPSALAIFDYELVPVAQQILIPKKNKKVFPKAHQKAIKVMLFANYLLDKPTFSADITTFKKPLITLAKSKISVAESAR